MPLAHCFLHQSYVPDDDTFPGLSEWGIVLIVQIRKYICHNRVSTQLRRLPPDRGGFPFAGCKPDGGAICTSVLADGLLMCTSVKPSVVAPGGPRMPSRPVWLVFGVALSLFLSLLLSLLKGVSLCKHAVIMGSFSVRRANLDVDPSSSPFQRLVPPALIRNIPRTSRPTDFRTLSRDGG